MNIIAFDVAAGRPYMTSVSFLRLNGKRHVYRDLSSPSIKRLNRVMKSATFSGVTLWRTGRMAISFDVDF